MYDDFEITQDEDGVVHLHSIDGVVSVLPDAHEKIETPPTNTNRGRYGIFTRAWIKMSAGNGEKEEVRGRVVVAELDGIRVYIQPGKVIITKRDLYF